jgi:hypothetical protein
MSASLKSREEARAHQLIVQPWPHLVVDDFLTDDVLAKSLSELNAEDYSFEIESRGTGRIEFSLLKSETLWRAIYSKQTVSLLASAFGDKLKLNKHNWLQLRRMNEDTPEFPLHNDFTSNEDTIASFLYLSGGWSVGCGGRLHLFESDKQGTPTVSIDPVENRFVAFRTKAAHWHAVERVYGWERRSVLALWDVDNSNELETV